MIKGCVYKIIDVRKPEEILYIGSTGNFKTRWNAHVQKSKKDNSAWNTFLREHGPEHFKMVGLMSIECETKHDLRKLEEVFRKQINPPYNTIRCWVKNQTIQEWNKEYYAKNNEKINNIRKVFITCECGREIKKWNIAKHRKTNLHKMRMSPPK